MALTPTIHSTVLVKSIPSIQITGQRCQGWGHPKLQFSEREKKRRINRTRFKGPSQPIDETADGPHKIIIAPAGAHGSHMSPPYMLWNMHAIIPLGKGGT